MIAFNKDYLEMFLGVVRKYMVMRGNYSQKDVAEMTDTSVSTMSRFLNLKTREFDDHMVAKIVAFLDIPLHEVIDFIDENSEGQFKKLVQFYKEWRETESPAAQGAAGSSRQSGSAKIRVGGKDRTIPFPSEGQRTSPETSSSEDAPLKEKLRTLSPRQKAYLAEFLSLDVEAKDLIVDLGNALFRYFRQKGFEL